MKSVAIPGTQLRCSKFIFGTAGLFDGRSQRHRIALLEAAVDHGFTHFDTAPYYGFGWAERDLRSVLKRHPDITVTTKVGIWSPGGEDQPAWQVLLRKAAGKVVASASRPTISFRIENATSALENSLRRLGRAHIDLYLLHEPEIQLLNTDEWQAWLERMVEAGKVRYFGLASTADRLAPFLAQATGLTPVVQMLDSLERREADVLLDCRRPLQITYGYVSSALSAGTRQSVPLILRQAVKRNPEGAIIVSTKRRDRLGQYANLLGSEP